MDGAGVWRRAISDIVHSITGVNGDQSPTRFRLEQNYPNPFNPSTTIHFDLPVASHAMLKIFNALGQEVDVLVDEARSAGTHTVQWNGAAFPSGVYLCRLQVNGFVETRKLVLLK
jgi:hypothetical protein